MSNRMASLEIVDDWSLAFSFTYDGALVQELKRVIPSSSRSWDGKLKRWLVTKKYESTCRALARKHLGVIINELVSAGHRKATEHRSLTLMYLGRAKHRDGIGSAALGHDGESWSQVYPTSVLREWFSAWAGNTLYSILGIPRSATLEGVRGAYRKMARIWHPDICKDPDATERFKMINEAHSVLSDARDRRIYDMNLSFRSIPEIKRDKYGWRPPLRCGILGVSGNMRLGQFVVSEIKKWEDIENGRGLILSTSWRYGDDSYTEEWV